MNLEKQQKIKKRIETIVPIDDEAFAFFAKNKGFCQEFLRVLLQDNNLIVIENEIQKFLTNVFFKNSILDMLCKLGDGRYVNVEIQLYEDEEHAKRIFQYASLIRQICLEKGSKYGGIKNIIIIYLTRDDIFKRGSTIYNVKMDIVSDQGDFVEEWNCGLKVLYINTVGLTNKTINEYLKQLTDRTTYIKKYEETVKAKKEIIEKGGEKMSAWMQNFIDEEREEGKMEGKIEGSIERQNIIFNTMLANGYTKEDIDKILVALNKNNKDSIPK